MNLGYRIFQPNQQGVWLNIDSDRFNEFKKIIKSVDSIAKEIDKNNSFCLEFSDLTHVKNTLLEFLQKTFPEQINSLNSIDEIRDLKISITGRDNWSGILRSLLAIYQQFINAEKVYFNYDKP